ncbi:MAG TPA: alpha/beta hydrolase [Planctomycetota bacterium]|nr:alpha/beta hydrolase [Planctomycetota bacterium]
MRSARSACAIVALLIVVLSLIADASALVAVLLASIPCALAALPSRWWNRPWLAIAALVLFALAGVYLPASRAFAQLPLEGRSAHWWALALQCWCGAGISLAVLAGAAWMLRLGGRWLGPVLALPTLLVAPLIGMPLMLLFPVHLVGTTPETAPHQDVTVVGADGIALRARLIEPDGAAHGLVVFTHGKAGWKERHAEIVGFLRGLGWAVLVWDLRGHGRSPPSACGHGPAEAEDLLRVWAAAQALRPDAPMVAYGISLGGAATLLAGDRLDGCRALIIENAFAALDDLVEANAPGPAAPVTRALCRLALGRWPREIRPLDAPVLAAGPPLTLGISGDDRVIPPAHGERLAAACPRATVVRVPGARHVGLIDDQAWRQAVAQALAAAQAAGH